MLRLQSMRYVDELDVRVLPFVPYLGTLGH